MVNTIQRCLTKACARMGLGIAIYGAMDFDDLPEEKQPLPDNVVDLTEIRQRLDVGIKNYTKGMSKEQKVHFVNTIIATLLGGERNWRLCENKEMLENLLDVVEGRVA